MFQLCFAPMGLNAVLVNFSINILSRRDLLTCRKPQSRMDLIFIEIFNMQFFKSRMDDIIKPDKNVLIW